MSVTVQSLPSVGRVMRRPQHTFNLRHEPFQIQPFLLAPVLPGETLKNALLQARAVSKPIRNRLCGWWLEYYIFYVKHRDLDERAELVEMALDPDWTMVNIDEDAASTPYYHSGYTINWSKLCLKRVVEEYFRNEGEAWDVKTIGGLPIASVMDHPASRLSLWLDSAMPTGPDVPVATDIPASELDAALRQYEFLRANSLVNMSYEDFLRTYGIRPDKEEHKPELIRYLRDWTYPTNHIADDGTASSAVVWSTTERADKDRFFREPGFIFGVTVARPKVYFNAQTGSLAGALRTAMSWLPAIMKEDVYSSLASFTDGTGAGSGPFGAALSGDYWLDLRDIFLYGDQYINHALNGTDTPFAALPDSTGQRRYMAEADVDKLFVGDIGGVIEQDGVVNLHILGAQVDTTPTF